MRTEAGICDETRSLVYTFLDELRDSGETNMFGAGPYLMDEFGLTKYQSRIILGEWMQDYQSGLLSQGEIS
jgi:hypothetical protein